MPHVMPSRVVSVAEDRFPHLAHNFDKDSAVAFGPEYGPRFLGLLNLIDKIPEELIAIGEDIYSEFILARAAISEWQHRWSSGNQDALRPPKGYDPIRVIRDALKRCPDSFPAPSSTSLLFVDDENLKQDLVQDIADAERALRNGEWKAATVLAGAATEALLLWRLSKITEQEVRRITAQCVDNRKLSRSPPDDIHRWDLHQFIIVASELDFIRSDTVREADLARSFRNLIHPGRSIRLAQKCDRGTAYIAFGALDHVTRDLGRSHQGESD